MYVVSETFRANIIVSQAKLPYNGLNILKLDTKNMGHTKLLPTHTEESLCLKHSSFIKVGLFYM